MHSTRGARPTGGSTNKADHTRRTSYAYGHRWRSPATKKAKSSAHGTWARPASREREF